ncbi:hypothetical protein A2U01_0117175, partial [Trifolium medium]|nr:hypothetical protein [Trifolium medium]
AVLTLIATVFIISGATMTFITTMFKLSLEKARRRARQALEEAAAARHELEEAAPRVSTTTETII